MRFVVVILCLFSLELLSQKENWGFKKASDGWNDQRKTFLYFHNSHFQQMFAQEAIAKAGLKKSERVLDFGCGDGRNSAEISFHTKKVVGADISAPMTQFAQEKYSFLPKLSFFHSKKLDASDLGSLGKFDHVTSFFVFHVVKDSIQTLKNLRKVMNPGGRMTVLTTSSEGDPRLRKALIKAMVDQKIKIPGKKPTKENPKINTLALAERIFKEAGWKEVKAELSLTPYVFVNEGEFFAWFQGTLGANFALIPEAERKAFNQFISEYKKTSPESFQSSGSIAMTLPRLLIQAKA